MGKIVINGQTFDVSGGTIRVDSHGVFINGVKMDGVDLAKPIKVEVEGDLKLNNLEVAGSLNVSGSVHGNVDVAGDCTIEGSVTGDVDVSGDADISGGVEGDVDASGSVSIRK